MKLISVFLILSFLTFSVDEFRYAFKNAKESEDNALSFHQLIQQDKQLNGNLKQAYLGASEIILANYGKKALEKINLFKSGKEKLEYAIEKEPKNIEIRLIRLIIQNETPAFLKYKNNIEEDKQFIIKNYNNANQDLKSFIKSTNDDLHLFTSNELK